MSQIKIIEFLYLCFVHEPFTRVYSIAKTLYLAMKSGVSLYLSTLRYFMDEVVVWKIKYDVSVC